MASRAWNAYQQLLRTRPKSTSILSSGAIMVVGDGLAQTFLSAEGSYDPVRSAIMCSWAMGGDAPVNIALLALVPKLFSARANAALAASSLSLPMAAAMATTFFTGGVFRNVPFFWYCTHAEEAVRARLEGRTPNWTRTRALVDAKLNEDLLPTITASASIWLPLNTFNFWITPAHFRVVFLSAAATMWFGYLSFVQNRSRHQRPDAKFAPEERPAELRAL
jgi:hypothetical protein